MVKRVYLFQPNYIGGTGQYTSYWLPYSIATLWATAARLDWVKDNFIVCDTIFSRIAITSLMSTIINPDVCMFSCYIWNEQYNITVAREIKQQYPDCVIIFGGPQVHNDGNTFIKLYPWIDCVVIGEGEVAIENILHAILQQGELDSCYRASRIQNLSWLPHCYADNTIMSDIVTANPSYKWSATLETNRGCPFGCTFCDWGSLTHSKVKCFDIDRVFAEIDWMAENSVEQIIIADANFGIFYERDRSIAEHIIRAAARCGFPKTVGITHYKNATDQVINIVSMLAEAGLNKGMSLAVQSINDETLHSIDRRNLEINQLEKMYKLCNDSNISYYTEFIMCLPHETASSWYDGICYAIERGCHGHLDIYPLEILRNAKIASQIDEHGYQLFSHEVNQPNDDSNIAERHWYAVSSRYMPRSDYVNAWMSSWIIVNFHTFGWAQIIARFVRNHVGTSYAEIYNSLHQWVKHSTVLSPIYYQYRNQFEQFLYHTGTSNVGIVTHDIVTVDALQDLFHKQSKLVQADIAAWASTVLTDADIYSAVLSIQNNYVTLYEDTRDCIVINCNYNIWEVCNGHTLCVGKYQTALHKTMSWDGVKDFHDKLYIKTRNQFYRRQIR